jgi:hypothetical protein
MSGPHSAHSAAGRISSIEKSMEIDKMATVPICVVGVTRKDVYLWSWNGDIEGYAKYVLMCIFVEREICRFVYNFTSVAISN